jgi:hypothetical protein
MILGQVINLLVRLNAWPYKRAAVTKAGFKDTL